MGGFPRQLSHATAFVLLVVVTAPLHSQPAGWKDPSPHASRFVPVGGDVRLEVLDWGGTGRPLVLLPGGGDTAHVFDDFATKLSGFHAYGITRRGFGQSGFAPLTAGADTFGDDVLAVLDALELKSPVLVGHSIGGQELSSIATRHPNRAAALVYFDAAYPYAFQNGKGPTMKEFLDLVNPQPPPPPRPISPRSTRSVATSLGFWGSHIPRESFASNASPRRKGGWGGRASFLAVRRCWQT
jgi:non-heme chloroperoxidase